jgi:hypothetical protein
METLSLRVTDPCFYCAQPLRDVAAQGCGSREFPQADVDRLCLVLVEARRRRRAT